MANKPELLIAPCSYQAAKYAVEKWHYSSSMPTPPIVRFGVWERDAFIGSVLFSRGGNNNLLRPYGLKQTEGCELTRIALTAHSVPVTRVVSLALKALKCEYPAMRLIVSYADPEQGHIGGVYQAGNWIYSGQTNPDIRYIDKQGRSWHSRQVSRTGVKRQYGEYRIVPKHSDCTKKVIEGKHRYLYPLDRAMRKQIAPLAQPYPKAD